ncbi:agmatine deiminase family protein [Caldimonas tepidiphila]|uniref:agmatine deiminase family protein n=1 Tax=Caldimonas tepidiphila TaxID=2315841 RepID=UPI000E5B82B5|nr:agmatine deiminase family protein [Caldimonas tepidiphila]
MNAQKMSRRPSARQLARHFRARTGCEPPQESRIYRTGQVSPVRAIAEFEPMGGVLIAYPGTVPARTGTPQQAPTGPRAFGIPDELIVRMQQNDSADPVHVFVLCADPNQREPIVRDLQRCAERLRIDFDPAKLHLVPWDTDTFWTRDYGPWWIRNTVSGRLGIAKHTYTTLGGGSVGLVEGAENVDPREGLGIFRPNDDYAAVKLSDFLNGPIRKWNGAAWPGGRKLPEIAVHDWYYLGLLDVGGNYMVNGKGAIASSYLVATQNEIPLGHGCGGSTPSGAVIDARMEYVLAQLNRFLGIHSYHVLADPTGTYIGHIDCWGKFLAEDKVLIASSQDEKINAAFDAIARSFREEGFRVYRVLCQDVYIPGADDPATSAAYTNSLMLNDRVYVPLAGKGYEQFDQAAIRAYQEALPEHLIVGISGKPEFPWLGTDAMHCRTREIPREVVKNWLASLEPAAAGSAAAA